MSVNNLSGHFDTKKIFRVTIGPVLMVVFSSVYSIVDGVFLSHFGGEGAFSGVNLVFPFLMVFGSLGFLFGTGGTAFVDKALGEKDEKKAGETFSLIVYSTLVFGLLASLLCYFLIPPAIHGLSGLSKTSSEAMEKNAVLYGHVLASGIALFILQNAFQSFFSAAGKQWTGFLFTVLAGVTNIVFDAVFIVGLRMGVLGAAIATLMGQFVGGALPLLYFRFRKGLPFRLGRTHFQPTLVLKAMGNGSSEFVSNAAASLVSTCYNIQLLSYVGEDGISAYATVMYVSYIFMAVFFGYSLGLAPAVAYQYGATNSSERKNLLRRSLVNLAVIGLVMFVLSESLSLPLARLFAGSNDNLRDLALSAIRIYSFVFLSCGFSIFASAFFTALSNGFVSALISLARSLVFELLFVFVLPLFWGVNGIWAAATFAEIGSSLLTLACYLVERRKYHY